MKKQTVNLQFTASEIKKLTEGKRKGETVQNLIQRRIKEFLKTHGYLEFEIPKKLAARMNAEAKRCGVSASSLYLRFLGDVTKGGAR